MFYPLCILLVLTTSVILKSFHSKSRPSDRVRKKNGKLCGNFQQYYAEESGDYAEKTPDYAEISKINKVVPLSFSNVLNTC